MVVAHTPFQGARAEADAFMVLTQATFRERALRGRHDTLALFTPLDNIPYCGRESLPLFVVGVYPIGRHR